MKIDQVLIRSLSLVSLFLSSWAMAQAVAGGQLNCAFVGPIQGVYFNQHINYNVPQKKKKLKTERAEIERKTIDQYIKRLDSTKIYFLQADIEKIRTLMKGILTEVEKRPNPNCKQLLKVQKIFKQRVKERVEFAKVYLDGKKFKFNGKTELILDPDHRKYPATRAQAEAFQKRYIQFRISTFLDTDMKLAEAKDRVVRWYDRIYRRVDEMTEDKVFAGYLDSFARSLDPHSSYFSADVMEDFRISMALSLEGIGATLSSQDGFTVVEQLISGGAAARDGQLKPKDKIVAVGQGRCIPEKESKEKSKKKKEKKKKCIMENVVEWDLRDVVKKIRGKKGTQVSLTILRKESGTKTRKTIVLVRDKVKLEDEAAQISYIDRKVGGQKYKIGLINLPSFYSDSKPGGRTAARDMKRILKEARKNKVNGIVLDFSSNGGGSLDDAVKIAGLFFKTGAVVKQSAKKKNQTILLEDDDSDVDFVGPMVVLTSRISASASEIVAGTLQDYRRAVVVGADHTFGKGSVQSVIPLPAGLGAAKVTVGMFYTAGGNSTQHRGVDADVVLPSALSNDEVGEKTLDYSLAPSALASFLSESAYVKDGEGAWQAVSDNEIKKLRSLSAVRVSQSEDFAKIEEEIKKNKKSNHLVKINEMLKEREENEEQKKEKDKKLDKFGNPSKSEKLAEYLKRADVQEAINVAADLVALKSGIEIRLGARAEKEEAVSTSP